MQRSLAMATHLGILDPKVAVAYRSRPRRLACYLQSPSAACEMGCANTGPSQTDYDLGPVLVEGCLGRPDGRLEVLVVQGWLDDLVAVAPRVRRLHAPDRRVPAVKERGSSLKCCLFLGEASRAVPGGRLLHGLGAALPALSAEIPLALHGCLRPKPFAGSGNALHLPGPGFGLICLMPVPC